MVELHTHRSDSTVFLWNFSAFLLRSSVSKSSLFYIIFQTPSQSSWSDLLSLCCTWTHLVLACHPRNLREISPHLHWVTYVLFTLGNRCTSSFFLLPASDPSSMPPTQFTRYFLWDIYVLFTLGNRCISCYVTNLCNLSKGSSSQYSTKRVLCCYGFF